jgi:hypothetical protein
VRFRGAPSPFGPLRATVAQPGDLRAGGAMPVYASRGVHAEGTAPFAAHGAPPHTFATADGMRGRVGGNVLLKIACSTVGQTGSLKRHTDLRAKAFSPSNIIGKQHDRSVARSNRSARASFSYHTLKAKMILTLVSIAISMENTLASGSIALTDATFSTAIASCLEEAASDGLCTSYGFASGFGAMPDWDTGNVTNMGGAFSSSNTPSMHPSGTGTRRR